MKRKAEPAPSESPRKEPRLLHPIEEAVREHARKVTLHSTEEYVTAYEQFADVGWFQLARDVPGLASWRHVIRIDEEMTGYAKNEVWFLAYAYYYHLESKKIERFRVPPDDFYLLSFFLGLKHHTDVITALLAPEDFADRVKQRQAWLASAACPLPLKLHVAWDRQLDRCAALRRQLTGLLGPRLLEEPEAACSALARDITETFTSLGMATRGYDPLEEGFG